MSADEEEDSTEKERERKNNERMSWNDKEWTNEAERYNIERGRERERERERMKGENEGREWREMEDCVSNVL